MNYNETLNYIHSLGNFSKPASLDRITELLNSHHNPQDNFHSVHIAGTNGKGSVSAMLAKIYECWGKKTGLYISPFIINFRERIQINGTYISEEDIIHYAEQVKSTNIEVTEFEFITALAFLYFSEQNCDMVIVETGLGGRLDATNTLNNPTAVVITKIGMDHTAILGDTIEKIAKEKCGIIKDCPVITSFNQEERAFKVIKDHAVNLTVPRISELEIIKSDMSGNRFLYKNKRYYVPLCGKHQIENALIVIETVDHTDYNIPYEVVYKALESVSFPARMEVISHNPLVILDGAHNPDGAAALAESLKEFKGRATAIIGVMKDKDYPELLKTTLIYCKAALAVCVKGMPRSLDAKELAVAASNFCPCSVEEDYLSAIKKAKEIAGGEPLFVFGSLYLASDIREKLINFYNNL